LSKFIGVYLEESRPILIGTKPPTDSLWISSTTGKPYTQKHLGSLISRLTRETIGVDVSPHLFRTAASTTAAILGGRYPHLASALLNHSDPRVTEEHYIRTSSISATTTYAEITRGFLD
jgi:integrase